MTCTSMEVVSSTTLFITARTFLGSMVLTQSRVSTLFLNIWEIIRPCTCRKKLSKQENLTFVKQKKNWLKSHFLMLNEKDEQNQ